MRPACVRLLGLVLLVCCVLAEVNWRLAVIAKQRLKWWWHPRIRLLRAAHQDHRLRVFEMLPAFSCISWACVFAGDGAAIFFSGLIGLPFGVIKRWRHVSVLTQWAGSFGISWCILSLVKKTLHCRRAGFEPQRTSSFRKRVRAHQVLGEAVRARTTIPHFVLTLKNFWWCWRALSATIAFL